MLLKLLERRFNVVSIIISILSILISVSIGYWYNKKLEKYKSDLSTFQAAKLEEIKFQNQTLMQDFNRYSSKIHEIYPEIFKRIIETNFELNEMFSGDKIDLEQLNLSELRELMNSWGAKSENIEDILKLWEFDKISPLSRIYEVRNKYLLKVLKETYANTRDYWLSNELYMSEEVTRLIGKIISMIGYQITGKERLKTTLDDFVNYTSRFSDYMSQLKSVQRNELSVGYSDFISKRLLNQKSQIG